MLEHGKSSRIPFVQTRRHLRADMKCGSGLVGPVSRTVSFGDGDGSVASCRLAGRGSRGLKTIDSDCVLLYLVADQTNAW